MKDCLFCKIRDGEIPADIVFSNEDCLAFKDIDPAAPAHVLLIPREHIATLNDLTTKHEGLMGRIMIAAKEVAYKLGIAESGYRLVTNCNADAGQIVFHIHFHLLGGREFGWPPG